MHTITECYYFPDSYRSFTIFLKVFTSLVIFMSVGWDVKWCPVSRITTPLARKRPSHWISITSKLVRTPGKLQNFRNYYRLLMVAAVMWQKYCRYSVKHYIINQPGISVGWDVKWCPVTRITTP